MKTMNNFAAQQLTKSQMNTINGGGGSSDNCGTLYLAVWIGGASYVCAKDKNAILQYIQGGAQIIEADKF